MKVYLVVYQWPQKDTSPGSCPGPPPCKQQLAHKDQIDLKCQSLEGSTASHPGKAGRGHILPSTPEVKADFLFSGLALIRSHFVTGSERRGT